MDLRKKEIHFDEVWARIRKTVEAVLNSQTVNRSEWNDCFNDLYELTQMRDGLAARLYPEIGNFFRQHVEKLNDAVETSDELLVTFNKVWSEFKQGIKYVDFLFRCLFVNNGNGMSDIGRSFLNIFRRNLVEPIGGRLVQLLIDGIQLDRNGSGENESLLRDVIHSFVELLEKEYEGTDILDLYQGIFETPFLKATGEYYQLEASRLLLENDKSQYMEKVLRIMEEEELRSRKYLHPSSYSKVTREIGERMVADQLQFLLSDFKRLTEEENKKDLKNLYLLLKIVPSSFEALIQEVQQYITKYLFEAIDALKGEKNPYGFIESFRSFHDKFSDWIKEVFCGDQQLIASFNMACVAVINHKENPNHPCQSPELLAKYCDSLLLKSAQTCSDDEVEKKITLAITIYKYLSDKDVFEKEYLIMFAKRFFNKQSMSMDAEAAMISKLEQVSRAEFTTKLRRMFNDISISSDLNRSFSEILRKLDMELDFSVSVLQAGSWPLTKAPISTFVIPQQLQRCVQEFEMFYNNRFRRRKLSWLHHISKAELKLCYLKKPYIVTMSTYQMAVLLLFERAEVLAYEEISARTTLSDKLLSAQIKSLLESKLLLATDSEKPIEAGTSFRLNQEYSNTRLKFKLAAVALKESAQEEEKKTYTDASLDEERNLYLQTAIVRIMKEKNVLVHNSLIQEVIGQAKDRFVPSVSMIKKCINVLIDKSYIKRTTECGNEYSYVA